MTHASSNSFIAFNGHHRIASGSLQTVALAVKRIIERGTASRILVFDDNTGRAVDIDTRGSDEEVCARFEKQTFESNEADIAAHKPRGRGRPKLGVISREVTMLPRHWEWLNAQPGGASVALRKLVEEARRIHSERDKRRKMQERAYNFMSAMAGNMSNFEEAIRALFAQDYLRLRELIEPWPEDVRIYTLYLVFENGHEERLQP